MAKNASTILEVAADWHELMMSVVIISVNKYDDIDDNVRQNVQVLLHHMIYSTYIQQ